MRRAGCDVYHEREEEEEEEGGPRVQVHKNSDTLEPTQQHDSMFMCHQLAPGVSHMTAVQTPASSWMCVREESSIVQVNQ